MLNAIYVKYLVTLRSRRSCFLGRIGEEEDSISRKDRQNLIFYF